MSQFSKEERDSRNVRQINFMLVPSKIVDLTIKQVIWGQLSKGVRASGAGMGSPGRHAKPTQFPCLSGSWTDESEDYCRPKTSGQGI